VRKAALRGAAVGFVNPEDYPYHFRHTYAEAPLASFVRSLAGVLVVAAKVTGRAIPQALVRDLEDVSAGPEHAAVARVLVGKKRGLVVLGHVAQRHPQFAEIRALTAALADVSGAELGYLAEGANGVGAALVGFLPHREPGGKPSSTAGFHTYDMLTSPRHGYVLFGLEPDGDIAEGALAEQALKSADIVVAFTSFASESLLECADVLLPIATYAETAGTYINAEGRWQSFAAAAEPVGEARPGWRVLRVLGNSLEVPGFEYRSAEEVRDEIAGALGEVAPDNAYRGTVELSLDDHETEGIEIDVPIYSVDAVVRRSVPLQNTPHARADDDPGRPLAEVGGG